MVMKRQENNEWLIPFCDQLRRLGFVTYRVASTPKGLMILIGCRAWLVPDPASTLKALRGLDVLGARSKVIELLGTELGTECEAEDAS